MMASPTGRQRASERRAFELMHALVQARNEGLRLQCEGRWDDATSAFLRVTRAVGGAPPSPSRQRQQQQAAGGGAELLLALASHARLDAAGDL